MVAWGFAHLKLIGPAAARLPIVPGLRDGRLIIIRGDVRVIEDLDDMLALIPLDAVLLRAVPLRPCAMKPKAMSDEHRLPCHHQREWLGRARQRCGFRHFIATGMDVSLDL